MDEVKLENLKILGIYGILHEPFKLINKWRKIFTQITLLFILPLSLLIFTNMEISFFLQKSSQEETILPDTQKSTPQFLKLPQLVSPGKIHFSLLNFTFSIISSIFSLLSITAVVYTVACIYAARDVSFAHVIAVLPKVWKRLFFTLLSNCATIFAFSFLAFAVFFLIPVIAIFIYGPNNVHTFLLVIETTVFFFIISYGIGIWYLTTILQLSYVVSVLEESCGFKAMAESKALLKGNMKMVIKLWVLLDLPLGVIQFVFLHYLVVTSGWVGKGILGICWVLLFLVFFLVKFVLETVVYFVCKLHHCESVDKLALWNHRQGLSAHHYDPLKVDDNVQLEKLQVV